jgi:DNA ligase 1
MHIVQTDDVRNWLTQSENFNEYGKGIGAKRLDNEYIKNTLQLPLHLQFVVDQLADESSDSAVSTNALDSIPFYSLCRGLFLPLSYLSPERTMQIFGLKVDKQPDTAQREKLVADFLDKEVGLTLVEKIGCMLGDVFLGKPSSYRRDSLLRLLGSVQMVARRDMLDRLTQVGDVAVLFAESRHGLKQELPLTAAEVIRTLRFLPGKKLSEKDNVLRSIWNRCGSLEAFFLAKLLLRKAGFGLEYQGPMVARLLANKFGAPEEQVGHAMALTDAFRVSEVLLEDGVEGLRKIQLQPLVPVKPMLAGGTVDEIKADEFPVWVERKYDGIRLMLHKSTDAQGSMLCGAYTRNRGDWLEQITGLESTIKAIPANTMIIDGELFGTVLDLDGARPATVYEVYAALQGEPSRPVNLKFAAFDAIFLNGRDLTRQTLSERRQMLQMLLSPMAHVPTPIPLSVAEGHMANAKDDLNRLFHHFRAQGYEGIITKTLNTPYLLNTRALEWKKRKPEITLDLVLVGATFAVTTKEYAGVFGSYVIAARTDDNGFEIVGDVAGVDKARDQEIQIEIMRDGLMTGERIERASASGVRPGIELRPSIVVTVKFEGITRDNVTGALSLRDLKLAVIRSDKSASEADKISAIEELYLRERVG